MKKISGFSWVLTLASILLAASTGSQASPYTLSPGGGFTALSSGYPLGGTVRDSLTCSFSSPNLSGTLISRVVSGDSANPYGGLTFTYQFNVDAASAQAASRLTVGSFAGFVTDVSFDHVAGAFLGLPTDPSLFSRSADGQVLRFSFDNQEVLPGEFSAMLVVQTAAPNYTLGTAAVIDGTAANAMALVPVPEPGTGGLLLAALGGLAWVVRRKHQ